MKTHTGNRRAMRIAWTISTLVLAALPFGANAEPQRMTAADMVELTRVSNR